MTVWLVTLVALAAPAAVAAPDSSPRTELDVTASSFPSGRTTYRTLADYNAEMRQLAEANPNLVRLIVLPHETWLGRDVLGIEVTENVARNDGKPAFLNLGLHHARDWPSGEHAMEWALELIEGYKSGDPRATNIVRNSRNIVVPVVNPDGFDSSRATGAAAGADGGRDESTEDTEYYVLGAGEEYRHKNCRLPDDSAAGNCTSSTGENGVDPDRNYGALWGGPGAEPANSAIQTYRGPGPFSEPETRNIQALVSSNQVVTLISNHTSGGLVLRAPGLAALGDAADESRGYKQLADDMARHNGYFSQRAFERYDSTGTAVDWAYLATGGFAFAFEIYCGAPNYEAGRCDDPAFHPLYETVVKEWTGDNPQADHTADPGGTFDGLGNREAYYLAAESTLDDERHAVLEGSGPAGATLRLTKEFKTETYPQPPGDAPLLVNERLETVYDIGADGRVRWHVNPSTRPMVAKATGVPNPGDASPPQTQTGGTAGSSTTGDDPDDGATSPDPNGNSEDSISFNDHPITVPATGDNASMSVRVSWASLVGDWDAKLYEDSNGDGKSQATEPVVSASQTGPSNVEEVSANGAPRLTPGKKYVLRVNNVAASAADNYEVDITFEPPLPFKAARTESYTLTCELGGRVFDTQQVQVDRGEVRQLDLGACARAIGGQNPDNGSPSQCASAALLRGVRVRPSGRRVRFRLPGRRPGVASVDVFQIALGRRVIKQRRVARFRRVKRSFVWNGRSRRKPVRPGFFFARLSARSSDGRRDVRTKALRLASGRFTARPDFARPESCGLLRSYALDRPVFGGSTRTPLKATFRLSEAANVRIQARRGRIRKTLVRTRRFAAGRRHRTKLSARGLPKGDYRVTIRVTRSGSPTVTSKLTARKL